MILQKMITFKVEEIAILYLFFFIFPTMRIYFGFKEKNLKKRIQGMAVFLVVLASYPMVHGVLNQYRRFEPNMSIGRELKLKEEKGANNPYSVVTVSKVERKYVTVMLQDGREVKKTKDSLFLKYNPTE